MNTGRMFPVVGGVLVSFVLQASAAVAGGPEPFFEFVSPSPATPYTLSAPDVDPTIIRQRAVALNMRALETRERSSGPQVVWMNFFDDDARYVTFGRTYPSPNGGTVRQGFIEGEALSEVTLVTNGGITVGNIRDGNGGYYQIRPDGDGGHVVRQIDESRFPPEIPPIPVFQGNGGTAFTSPLPEGDMIVPVLPVDPNPADPPVMSDDGSTIDVLVLYTNSARAAAGGTTAMENLINLAITETNAGYANSSVIQRVRLVHTREVTYDESGGSGMSTALSRLANASDGAMDVAHTLRNTYAADLVVLIINNSQYCGLGYLMTTESSSFAPYGFSTVHYSCATGNYTFAHEMGHNQGSAHDHANANGFGTPVNYYAYGYQHTTSPKFYTVMAYYCSGCVRINYWSSPEVRYQGTPTGRAANLSLPANNMMSLNQTRDTVANFRSAIYTSPPSPASQNAPAGTIYTNRPTYQWDAVADATRYNLIVKDTGGWRVNAWYDTSQAGCGSGIGTCAVTPATSLAAGSAKWWVIASNPAGDAAAGSGTDFAPSVPDGVTTLNPSGPVYQSTPLYQWSSRFSAKGYHLIVKDATGFTINTSYTSAQVGCTAYGSTCGIRPNVPLAPGEARWWVKPFNDLGEGPLTGPTIFTLNAPLNVTLVAPGSGASVFSNRPIYQWRATMSATRYNLIVKDMSGWRINAWYSAAQASCTTYGSTCSIRPAVPLASGQVRWWLVPANDIGNGNTAGPVVFTAP